MSETIRHVIFICAVSLSFTLLIPWIYGIVRYRYNDPPLRWFVAFLTISLISGIAETVYAAMSLRNLWISNLSNPLYIFVALWMFSLWQPGSRRRSIIRYAIAGYIVVWLIEVTVYRRFNEYTLVSQPLMGVMFITLACLTIYHLNRSLERPLLDEPSFWISAGIMLFYGGTLAINLVSNILLRTSEPSLFQVALAIPILDLIAYIMFTIAFRCQYRLQRQNSSG
jgi:hypothetical protein